MINKYTSLLWILMILLLLAGCSSDGGKLAELEQENAALAAQVDTLSAQLNTIKSTTLDSWELTASAGETSDAPVSVLFSAIPGIHLPEQEASLEITLNGRITDTIPCIWDGTAFTAYVTLTPADGYSYYCLLSSGEKLERISLSTPDYPQKPALTFLASGMEQYCKLVIDGWDVHGGTLVLTSGTGTVQLPLLERNGQSAQCTKAQLILQKNGNTVQSKDAALVPGETQGSSYVLISDAEFLLPRLAPEDQLDLWLEVSLSTGETLSSPCVSWYPTENSLELAVG